MKFAHETLSRRWTRRCFASAAALALAGAALAAAPVGNTPTPLRPNLLVIVADDLGFSDLGCYGGEIQTPHLDALAGAGVRFTQFYNTGRCWPTRASLLTGYYAQEVRRDTVPGVRSGAAGQRPAWAPLLPERLRPLRYRAYHAGKWHVDGPVLAGGFDRSYRVEDHDRYFAPRAHYEDDVALPPVRPEDGYYSSTAIADRAIAYLREHAAQTPEQPFFLYLCFLAPHFPLQAPAADIARYRERYRAGWNVVRQERHRRLTELGLPHYGLSPLEPEVGPPYHFPEALAALGPGEVNRPRPWVELTEAQREFQALKMAIHAAMVDRMDREIGRVLAELKARGWFENTAIFFLSDNGASAEIMVRGDGHDPAAAAGGPGSFLCLGPGWSSAANTPFRRHKTWVHEGGIATPLIVHWPRGLRARGEYRHTPGHVCDLAPTLLELAGGRWENAPGAPALTGRSLVPVLAADAPVAREALWWLHEGHRALRVGDWKLVAAAGQPWELYDLARDRSEMTNRAAARPDLVDRLARAWTNQWETIQARARQDLPASSGP